MVGTITEYYQENRKTLIEPQQSFPRRKNKIAFPRKPSRVTFVVNMKIFQEFTLTLEALYQSRSPFHRRN
jgi:hypothetical protein